MFAFLNRLFGKFDRQELAFERAAVAAEEFAADVEKLRDNFRERLNRTALLPEPAEETARIGRRKTASA